MTQPRRQRRTQKPATQVVEHDDGAEGDLLLYDVEDFLKANHPANDMYMQGLAQIQRNIMGLSNRLRHKQVNMLKSVFSGASYAETARIHSSSSQTVSALVKSQLGSELLTALQYHQTLIEGPNMAQRRNMLWRIAVANETIDPKVSIAASSEANKMTFHDHKVKIQNQEMDAAGQGGKSIVINPDLLPAGKLDE